MPRSAKSVSTEYVAALVIALAMALLAGCDGSGGIVAGDQDTAIDFGETDTTKQLDVQNTSDQDVTFELLVNYGDGPKDWLTYGPITAECDPAQSVVFTLEADRNALPAGLWEAEVVATSGAIRKSVIVSIAVVAAATNINTHNFWTSSEPLEFQVWNAGGGELQFEVAKIPAWLAVENGTGTSTGPTDQKTVTLSPNRSGLKPGTYSDKVVVLPVNGLSTFRKTIDVTMTVLPPGVPALTIQATPSSGDAPLEVQFKAMNGSVLADNPTAGYTINWDFGDDTTVGQGNQVSHRFASSGTFLVTLSLVGALGTFDCHQATITVNSDPAQPGALVVTPTDDAIFSGPPGGPYTSVNDVTSYNLKNVGDKSISWTAGAGAPSWVSVTKGSGMVDPGMTDTAPITVNSNANNLTAGNYSGSVVFARSDGTVITTRKVSLTIAPIANDDSYSINEDKTLNVMAVAGVLANDPGHGQLPAVLVSGPRHGSVTLNPNGSFSYSPAANFNSSDSFSYRLTDGTLTSNTATVSITVKPVNDPPSFTVPGMQGMNLNTSLQVDMTAVSPGPADEAGQVVTFTATSNDESVIPNANLVSAGSTLTITSGTSSGVVTITVTAQDNGGTANGGRNTSSSKTFSLSVGGSPISGQVTRVIAGGGTSAVNGLGITFTGTGSSVGHNLTVTTAADGTYSALAPIGWTGTIAATDPDNWQLTPANRGFANVQTAQPSQNFLAGRNYYVATTGSDTAAGTLAAPYATLSKFLGVAQPGDTCLIRAGIYDGSLSGWSRLRSTISGTPDHWIVVQNYPGEECLIDLAATSSTYVGSSRTFVYLTQSNAYLRFQGLHTKNFGVSFNCDTDAGYHSPHHIDFEDLECSYSGLWGTSGEDGKPIRLISGAHDINIRRCNFHHVAGPGVVGYGAVSNILIEDCDSHDNDDARGVDGDADGFTFTNRTTTAGYGPSDGYPLNVTFRRCRVWNTTEDGFDVKGDNITYDHCMSWNNAGNCYKAWSLADITATPAVGVAQGRFTVMDCLGYNAGESVFECFRHPDVTILNSTFVGTDTCAMSTSLGYTYDADQQPARGEQTFLYNMKDNTSEWWNGRVVMKNCVLIHLGSKSPAIACEIDKASMALIDMDYNVVHDALMPAQAFTVRNGGAGTAVYYSNTAIETGALFTAQGVMQHGRGLLPVFVDANSANFHLSASDTIAHNTGIDLSVLGVVQDLDGQARPQGEAFDRGCYECP